MAATTDRKPPPDLIMRGVKEPSPAGTLTFIGLRALDPFLQYQLLVPGGWGAALLSKAGIASIVPRAFAATGIASIDGLGLPLPQLLLLTMAVGSAVKQIYWLVCLSKETFPLKNAFAVSAYNTFVNTVNVLLFLSAATSSLSGASFPGTSIPYAYVVGPTLFVLGMTLEAASETQRKIFKDNPKNQGKIIRSGLWSWARHINYGGYALWRGAYALTSSGIVGGLIAGGIFAWDFVNRAVPTLDQYCEGRYGEQWRAFKREVKWVVLPGLY